MKTFILFLKNNNQKLYPIQIAHVLCISIISWLAMPYLFAAFNSSAGFVDISVLHLVLFALCCWLSALLVTYWLFRLFLQQMALPAIVQLITQFNLLSLWEQYLCYLAGYALLLCSAIATLIAVL